MRVMVLVKATADSEAGMLPSTELLEAVGAYNQQLIDAGVMRGGEGLLPSEHGRRIRFSGANADIVAGPFDVEPGAGSGLVSGFWIWQVDSMQHATDWAAQAPLPPGSELELRPIAGAEDFGDALTPELREQEQAQRSHLDGGPAHRR